MNHIGKKLGVSGFKVIELPDLTPEEKENFNSLPEDPYYKERWRQFSQYILFFENDSWTAKKLKHRPFVQSKTYNHKVGGVKRLLDPISNVNPTPHFQKIAEELEFNKHEVFQVNLHQWRTKSDEINKGHTIPEGPHRDGHHITSVTVWNRHNVSGGESLLYQTGKPKPFFRTTLKNGQCLIMRDEDLVHGATDIKAIGDEPGYRDIWVISINPWSDRKYGDDFEHFATSEFVISSSNQENSESKTV